MNIFERQLEMRYFTNSLFKLAMQCVTKLYYTKKEDYIEECIDDPFLDALINGGFQVKELAKFLFCDDPVEQKITVGTDLDDDESLKETTKRLEEENTVIAEAAFSHQSLFARTDIIVKQGEIIDFYAVQPNRMAGHDSHFISQRGRARILNAWIQYLYNIAFQKHVLANSLGTQNITVRTNLISVDMSKTAAVDGLNQKFKISKETNGFKIEHIPYLTKQMLDNSILKVQNIDEVIQKILYEFPVPNDFNPNMKFISFVDFCTQLYLKDVQFYSPLDKKCKYCQFINRTPENNSRKSGFNECWNRHTNLSNENLVINLWDQYGGRRNIIKDLIEKEKYLLKEVSEKDIAPKSTSNKQIGLSPHERRMEQISRVQNNTEDSYFNIDGLKKEMASWIYPLHMITFYTLKPALPFEKGWPPYREIAFQFSHHTIEKNGDVCHCNQLLSFQPCVNPIYELSDQLSLQFNKVKGTVFGYHNYRWDIPYRKEGIVDLHKLVQKYYYSPFTKGNTSLRTTLYAIIQESDFLKNKYSKPIYGRSKQVKSLNYDEHVWIDPAFGMDPYKTLPALFEDYGTEGLCKCFSYDETLAHRNATAAYSLLHFSYISPDLIGKLKEALLKHCEMDTMAMAMILEAWLA